MKLVLTLLLTLPFLTLLGSAQDQTVSVPELETLEKEYTKLVKTADGQHLAAVTELDKKYIAKLEQAKQTAQQAGRLDEALAIDEDMKSFSSGNGMPVGVDAKTPPMLIQMHAIYRAEIAKLEVARIRNHDPLRDDYASELDALVMRLTKDGKLKEAMTVRKLCQSLPASAASAATPPIRPSVATGGKVTAESLDVMLELCRKTTGAKPLSRAVDGSVTLSGKYYAANGLLVGKAATLTLDAGTVIVMPPGSQIRVEGNIKVRGSPGKWVVVCCEEKGASRWDGFLFVSVEGANYKPLTVNGLVVTDAKAGIDITPGWPYQARQYEFSDCVFVGNSIGMSAGQYGSGQQPDGWVKNSFFLRNDNIGFLTMHFTVLVRTPRASGCTFAENGTGIGCSLSRYSSQVTLADNCLFVKNGIGVNGASAQGLIRKCVFEQNKVHLQLPDDKSVAEAPGNYWGEETTQLLKSSEGADSGGKISRSATIKNWLQLLPPGKIGADFVDVSSHAATDNAELEEVPNKIIR
jgi:hypothetical protein